MAWLGEGERREDLLAVLPKLAQQFEGLYQQLWQLPYVPAQTLELCRLRVAQLHACDAEFARSEVELPADKREHLSRWPSHPGFSEAERACLALAEVYTADPQAITDEQADAVKACYGEPGLVALLEALGLFYGLTRLSLLWRLRAEPAAAVDGGAA